MMKSKALHEARRSAIASWLMTTKARSFGRVIRWCVKQEGGVLSSQSFRDHLLRTRQINLGEYSYGEVEDILNFPVKTRIGRYTSIGPGVKAFSANHPYGFLSMHPFFYRDDIGIAKHEKIVRKTLNIGHDVWIGANAIICPGCENIGNGAIIAAGAVVTKDVPDFAICGGNPARVMRMRFDDDLAKRINDSNWWLNDLSELQKYESEMTQDIAKINAQELLNHLKVRP